MGLASAKYGFRTTLHAPFDSAKERVTAALKEQGFGILTEIDVRATLKEKLGVDFPRYVILGACNPPLAHRALTAEPEIGLILPCNVVVYETDDGDSVVAAADPDVMLGVVPNRALDPVAAEAGERLRKALEALSA